MAKLLHRQIAILPRQITNLSIAKSKYRKIGYIQIIESENRHVANFSNHIITISSYRPRIKQPNKKISNLPNLQSPKTPNHRIAGVPYLQVAKSTSHQKATTTNRQIILLLAPRSKICTATTISATTNKNGSNQAQWYYFLAPPIIIIIPPLTYLFSLPP